MKATILQIIRGKRGWYARADVYDPADGLTQRINLPLSHSEALATMPGDEWELAVVPVKVNDELQVLADAKREGQGQYVGDLREETGIVP